MYVNGLMSHPALFQVWPMTATVAIVKQHRHLSDFSKIKHWCDILIRYAVLAIHETMTQVYFASIKLLYTNSPSNM